MICLFYLKEKVKFIQSDLFWKKLCDKSKNCTIIDVNEMDELYYLNPQKKIIKNLYGASSNYGIHRDCVINFNGVKLYRILIGLNNGNDHTTTFMTNLKVGKKLNKGDFIVFDFNKTTHQVLKDKESVNPRILLKLHYIVCENCNNSLQYIENIKKFYIWYEYVTRYIMETGTDPHNFYEFFWGLLCQFFMNKNTKFILLLMIFSILILLKYYLHINITTKNISKIIKIILISLFAIYLSVVLFYYTRYKLFKIK